MGKSSEDPTVVDEMFADLARADPRFQHVIDVEKLEAPDVVTETPIYLFERIADLVLERFRDGDAELLGKVDELLQRYADAAEVQTVVSLSLGESLYFDIEGWTVAQIEAFARQYSSQMSDAINLPLALEHARRRAAEQDGG